MNNGDGRFAEPVDYNLGQNPWAVGIGDFNNDSNPDIAVSMGFDNVLLLYNNGYGTFSGGANYITGGDFPVSIAIADFNQDGYDDIAVTNMGSKTLSVSLTNTTQPVFTDDSGNKTSTDRSTSTSSWNPYTTGIHLGSYIPGFGNTSPLTGGFIDRSGTAYGIGLPLGSVLPIGVGTSSFGNTSPFGLSNIYGNNQSIYGNSISLGRSSQSLTGFPFVGTTPDFTSTLPYQNQSVFGNSFGFGGYNQSLGGYNQLFGSYNQPFGNVFTFGSAFPISGGMTYGNSMPYFANNSFLGGTFSNLGYNFGSTGRFSFGFDTFDFGFNLPF